MTDAPDIDAQILEVELTILAREDWLERAPTFPRKRDPATIKRAEDRLEAQRAVLATLQIMKGMRRPEIGTPHQRRRRT